jgi:hypothetical protein
MEAGLIAAVCPGASSAAQQALIAAAAEKDVLRIKAEIRDLYIGVPDPPRAGASQTYTISVSAMRLVTELRDAPTAAAIWARIIRAQLDDAHGVGGNS